MCYQCGNLHLVGYIDADWRGNLDERKSTSRYVFLLNNGAISWSSKKQTCIALSIMEAEFVACAAAVQETIWLKRFLQNLWIGVNSSVSIVINYDSQAAIDYTRDPKYYGKMKHIDTKYHFVRDIIAQKKIILQHISTHKMVADLLTKPITRDVFLYHVKTLGLRRL